MFGSPNKLGSNFQDLILFFSITKPSKIVAANLKKSLVLLQLMLSLKGFENRILIFVS